MAEPAVSRAASIGKVDLTENQPSPVVDDGGAQQRWNLADLQGGLVPQILLSADEDDDDRPEGSEYERTIPRRGLLSADGAENAYNKLVAASLRLARTSNTGQSKASTMAESETCPLPDAVVSECGSPLPSPKSQSKRPDVPPRVSGPAAPPVLTTEQHRAQNAEKRSRVWRRVLSFVMLVIGLSNFVLVPLRLGFDAPADRDIALELILDVLVWPCAVVLKLQERDRTLRLFDWTLIAGSVPLYVVPLLNSADGTIVQYWRLNHLLTTPLTPHYLSAAFPNAKILRPLQSRIVEVALIGLCLMHVLCCGLHAVFRAEERETEVWLNSNTVWDRSTLHQYLTAADWTFRQMMGTNSALPMTDTQVSYSMFTAAIGVCLYTIVLAVGTSTVSGIERSAGRLSNKLDEVRDIMTHMKLPVWFQEDVVRYYRSMWASCKSFSTEEKEYIISELPESLAERLNLQLVGQVVAKIPLFRNVCRAHDFLSKIVGALQLVVALPGQVICARGEIGEEMFFLHRGRIAVLEQDGSLLAYLYDGACFGELSLLFGQARTATVEAVDMSQIYVLTKQDFDVIIDHHPHALVGMLAAAQQRMKDAEERAGGVLEHSGTVTDLAATRGQSVLNTTASPGTASLAFAPDDGMFPGDFAALFADQVCVVGNHPWVAPFSFSENGSEMEDQPHTPGLPGVRGSVTPGARSRHSHVSFGRQGTSDLFAGIGLQHRLSVTSRASSVRLGDEKRGSILLPDGVLQRKSIVGASASPPELPSPPSMRRESLAVRLRGRKESVAAGGAPPRRTSRAAPDAPASPFRVPRLKRSRSNIRQPSSKALVDSSREDPGNAAELKSYLAGMSE
eukprot:TRINITY_DN1647_c1_g4_i1.p1 TRINITY_DN1647_c1_g4~~TRINITY_DN1647_c1_g4_i1.p1  ORF type:complete len:934 (+),score=197.96 TRINITY_DN1647_c1_g4_i1:260-2803(+)